MENITKDIGKISANENQFTCEAVMNIWKVWVQQLFLINCFSFICMLKRKYELIELIITLIR